jgi:hypothetical protein
MEWAIGTACMPLAFRAGLTSFSPNCKAASNRGPLSAAHRLSSQAKRVWCYRRRRLISQREQNRNFWRSTPARRGGRSAITIGCIGADPSSCASRFSTSDGRNK